MPVSDSVRITFEEDNDRVTLEVEGIDKDFPEMLENVNKHTKRPGEMSSNNNTMVASSQEGRITAGRREVRPATSGLAEKFRNMVQTASSAMSSDDLSLTREEGEMQSSEDDEGDDNVSISSSV